MSMIKSNFSHEINNHSEEMQQSIAEQEQTTKEQLKETYVKNYMAVTKLNNGWLLSVEFIDEQYDWIEDYISEKELRECLEFMAEIINKFGVPKIGEYILFDNGDGRVRDVTYRCAERHLIISIYS